MIIRPAKACENVLLSKLALRSKAHWSYDRAFLDACRAELTLTPEYMNSHPTFVLDEGRPVGFYSLHGDPPQAELSFMFVAPAAIGKGYGSLLWRHAVQTAEKLGFQELVVDSDPHAEGFYLRMGSHRAATASSGSVPGRLLPRLVLMLGV